MQSEKRSMTMRTREMIYEVGDKAYYEYITHLRIGFMNRRSLLSFLTVNMVV